MANMKAKAAEIVKAKGGNTRAIELEKFFVFVQDLK